MNPVLELSMACGLIILLPGLTFVGGVWIIVRKFGIHSRFSFILLATIIGLVAFEASFFGMVIDPRQNLPWSKILTISGSVGIVATLSVVIFTPVYIGLTKIFKR